MPWVHHSPTLRGNHVPTLVPNRHDVDISVVAGYTKLTKTVINIIILFSQLSLLNTPVQFHCTIQRISSMYNCKLSVTALYIVEKFNTNIGLFF